MKATYNPVTKNTRDPKPGDLVQVNGEEWVFLLLRRTEKPNHFAYVSLTTGQLFESGNFTGARLFQGTVTLENEE